MAPTPRNLFHSEMRKTLWRMANVQPEDEEVVVRGWDAFTYAVPRASVVDSADWTFPECLGQQFPYCDTLFDEASSVPGSWDDAERFVDCKRAKLTTGDASR